MAVTARDIALKAFAAPAWCSAADSLFQATGITVTVMDFRKCDVLAGGHRCGYCHLSTDIQSPGPLSCFDACPDPDAGPGRIICRAGLATLYAPVLFDDRPIAHVVVSGFVTSTRERRGLYEHLINRGVPEDSARRAVKSLPVIARRQAEAYLQLAVSSARTIVDATAERMSSAERIEELRLFVSAGRQVVSTERLDAESLAVIAEEAVALVAGEAGAILRPRGTLLEVVARTQAWRGPLGAMVPQASTAAGRALETRRTIVTPSRGSSSATLAMPLAIGERVLGILEVRLPQDELPLSNDRVSRLGRFAGFVAIALEREDERNAVERAMSGYAQLNELAAALGGQSDVDGVAALVISVLDKAFSYEIAGLVLTGWGRDRADVLIDGPVHPRDVDYVLGVASGRDVDAVPFAQMRPVCTHGEISEDAAVVGEWAMLVVELAYGDLNVGWLFLARADGEHFHEQDRALLDGIGVHAGAAFGRAAMFSRIRDDYAKTIAALSATLDLGERADQGHAGRVMEYAMMIGRELGLGYEKVEQLRFAGLLHDVGKTGVPEEILLKPSALTAEELAEVQRHAEIGATLVDQIDFLKSLTPIILHHHERFDGKGYPHGLKGEDIPLLARVLAVADAYDAMTYSRTYKPTVSPKQAAAELEAGAGTQFDPRVVAAMLEVLEKQIIAGASGLMAPQSSRSRPDLPM